MIEKLLKLFNILLFIFLLGFIGFEFWTLGAYLVRTYL